MFVTDPNRSCRKSNFVAFSELNPTYQTIPSLGFLYDVIRHHREEPYKIEILNSCNGLFVLVAIWKFSRVINYCVCNPTTKTFTLLPTGPRLHYSAYLVFEPSISGHYKLVIYRPGVKGAKLDIYSSENRSWKIIASPFDDPYPFANGFYLNGKIYWLSTHNSICFDSYNDELKPMNVPPNTDPAVWTPLPVAGSKLYYLDRKDDESSPDFRLIEITSDFSEWVTKYDTDVCPLLHAFPQVVYRYFLEGQEHESVRFCFSGICGVEEDEAQFVLGIPGKLVLYNLKEKTTQEIYNLPAELSSQYGYK